MDIASEINHGEPQPESILPARQLPIKRGGPPHAKVRQRWSFLVSVEALIVTVLVNVMPAAVPRLAP
jgi:hypothetical protein